MPGMAHTIEPATTGRAGCRGCGAKIPKDELRFGERVPNPFADEGDTTLWFHLECAAMKRPEPLLETLASLDSAPDNADALARIARFGVEHRRVPRVDGAQRSPSGRASCRACREKIEKDTWRIKLVFYDEGRFEPSGYVHAGCASAYFETSDLAERVRRFSELTDEDAAELAAALA